MHSLLEERGSDRSYCKHKDIVKPCIQYTCILVQAKVVLVHLHMNVKMEKMMFATSTVGAHSF